MENIKIRHSRPNDLGGIKAIFEIEGTSKMNAFRNSEYIDAYYMARLKESAV